MHGGASRRDQIGRLAVEAGEHVPAEPTAFEGDDPVGEVFAGLQHGETSVNSSSIRVHRRVVHQPPNSLCDRGDLPPIAACEHPDKFGKGRKRHRHDFWGPEHIGRKVRLVRIVGIPLKRK